MDTAGSQPLSTLILCDFDGTVSQTDTVNRLVRTHIGDPEWRFLVKRYMRGEVGSKGVYESAGPLMRMTRLQLEQFVRSYAQLDAGFPAFLQWAGERNIDVKIVSDGFDATIHTLLDNHGIRGVEVLANKLEMDEAGNVRLSSPHCNPECGMCGTCKREVIRAARKRYDKIILIGDGESDRHAAREADEVIALKDLFIYCAREGIPAIRADGFHEIPKLLSRRLKGVTFDLDGTLLDSIESIAASFNSMFAALGYPAMTVEDVARKTCISLKDFIDSFLKPEHREIGIKIFTDYYDTVCLEKTKVIPGVRETLAALDGTVTQGIVTNKRGIYARRLAEHFGIARSMARIIGAEDGYKAKPSSEMFDEFMRAEGLQRDETIYVGDSPIDVHAARNAGIDAFVVASSIFSAEELALHGPRRVLAKIAELPKALGAIV
ncbi:MAG: HAD-IB family phosphatase [Thermodesulfobacteriota bacterium]